MLIEIVCTEECYIDNYEHVEGCDLYGTAYEIQGRWRDKQKVGALERFQEELERIEEEYDHRLRQDLVITRSEIPGYGIQDDLRRINNEKKDP